MRKAKYKILVAIFLCCGLTAASFMSQRASATVPGINSIVSLDSSGNSGNGDSGTSNFGPQTIPSADGKFVAFNAKATNLVSSDTNGVQDVFLRDLTSNTTSLVSTTSSGTQMTSTSSLMAISRTGRYVLFDSYADTQLFSDNDVYLKDMQTGTLTNISTASATGTAPGVNWANQGMGVSDDGRYVLVAGITNGKFHTFMLDRTLNAWQVVDNSSNGLQNQPQTQPRSRMSCDGAFIVFESYANDLTSDTSNGYDNVFLLDTRGGNRITNITANMNGNSEHPTISCNGQYVGFASNATDIVSGVPSNTYGYFYEYDRLTGNFALLDQSSSGVVSDNASAFSNNQVSPTLSDQGNALFASGADNLAPLSMKPGSSHLAGQTYLRNIHTNTTEVLTKNSSGYDASGTAGPAWISADGKIAVLYASDDSWLVDNDTNGHLDVILAQTGL
jgi:hypothetical protein